MYTVHPDSTIVNGTPAPVLDRPKYLVPPDYFTVECETKAERAKLAEAEADLKRATDEVHAELSKDMAEWLDKLDTHMDIAYSAVSDRMLDAISSEIAARTNHTPRVVRNALVNAHQRLHEWMCAESSGKCGNAVGDPYLMRARQSIRRLERYLGQPARKLVPVLYDLD